MTGNRKTKLNVVVVKMTDMNVIVAMTEIVGGHRFLTLAFVMMVLVSVMVNVTAPPAEYVNLVQMETVTPTHLVVPSVVIVEKMEIVTLPYVV